MAGQRNATRRPGRKVEGVVRGLGHGGEGVVETEGGLIFVPGALPGERVRITLGGKARGVQRGRLIRVLEPSEARVEAPCALVARCGGCPLMVLDPAAQRSHKAALASRAVGIPVEVEHRQDLGYRRRARLAFEPGTDGPRRKGMQHGKRVKRSDGGAGGDRLPAVGYRPGRGRGVVDTEACPILTPAASGALGVIRQRLRSQLRGEGELQLAMGAEAPVLWLRTDDAQPSGLYGALEDAVAEGLLGGAVLSVEGSAASFGEPRECVPGYDGRPLVGPPFGFSQANEDINRELVAYVLARAEPDGKRVVELYAGHGNLSIGLAGSAQSFLAVEQNPEAAAACRDNLAARGLGGKVRAGDAGDRLTGVRGADVVVLDPPRTGAREALPEVRRLAPARVVYVSCDPPTLGRDIGELVAAGYRVEAARAFDMFPHTAHLEIVVQLDRDLRSDSR